MNFGIPFKGSEKNNFKKKKKENYSIFEGPIGKEV